ncbi:unnamed protein product [Callosobruchus maculatus]|uniref:Secreted protein n=1 Tax=Callosobruchus maculatus TaxID=64391 RepID=A0A653CDH4_CALMS|nr:unnamed protein product [Callosobruchus maculatus]
MNYYCAHLFLVVLICFIRQDECKPQSETRMRSTNQMPPRPFVVLNSPIIQKGKSKNPNCFGFGFRFPGQSTSTTPAPAQEIK